MKNSATEQSPPATEATPFDDGALYDLFFERLDYGLDFYLGLAKAARGPVLDVACGTGRIVLPCLKAGLDAEGFHVVGKTWEELAGFYRQVRTLYIGIFGFMGLVLIVVVLLAAANTMMMAAAERTREIGTLRALGTRPSTIKRMFLAEGLILAIAGCAGGALVALLVRFVLNRAGLILPPPPGVSHGMPLHVNFYATAYAAGAVAMTVTLVAASWFPARRAARISIIEALAHV